MRASVGIAEAVLLTSAIMKDATASAADESATRGVARRNDPQTYASLQAGRRGRDRGLNYRGGGRAETAWSCRGVLVVTSMKRGSPAFSFITM